MKKLVLFFVGSVLLAQNPDCQIAFDIDGSNTSSSVIDNTNRGCIKWYFTAVYRGAGSTAISVQTSVDNVTYADSGATYTNLDDTTGTFPITITATNAVTFKGFSRYLKVKLTTAAAGSRVTGTLKGFANLSASGSGNGTVTGTGTTLQGAFWSSSSALTAKTTFLSTATTPSTTTPNSPVTLTNADGKTAFYMARIGSAPSSDVAIFDSNGSGNVAKFRLIGPLGSIAEFFDGGDGSGWLMQGFGRLTGATFTTTTNCSSAAAPAVCAAANAGSVVVAAAATTVVVNTTAVTANSQILVMYDSSLGTKLGVTCNVTEPALFGVTARVAATSFTITATAPITNPACFSYFIVN